MSGYALSARAVRDRDAIISYLVDKSPAAAVRVYDAIYSACVMLGAQPGLGHAREDLTAKPLKFWSVFAYHVIYDPATTPISIVAIVHGARDLAAVLDDL